MTLMERLEIRQSSYSVPEIRKMLGLKKTASYWLIHNREIKTVMLEDEIRVDRNSFERWYGNQIKYEKINGPAPGRRLRKKSYSPQELAALLDVSDDTIYTLIHKGVLKTFKSDCWLRITKKSFLEWYPTQERLRLPEDRKRDREQEENSISVTEAARFLGLHRNNMYSMIENNPGRFSVICIAGMDRITKDSFNAWFLQQNQYHPARSCRYIERKAARKLDAQPDWLLSLEQLRLFADVLPNNGQNFVRDYAQYLDIVYIINRKYITKASLYEWLLKNPDRYQSLSEEARLLLPNLETGNLQEEIEEPESSEQDISEITTELFEPPEEPAPEAAWYTVSDLQGILTMGRKGVNRLLEQGEFQVIRVGKNIRIPKEDFNAWLAFRVMQNREEGA